MWPAGAVSLVAVAAGAYVTLALRPAAGAGGMFVGMRGRVCCLILDDDDHISNNIISALTRGTEGGKNFVKRHAWRDDDDQKLIDLVASHKQK